jgi:hypothetical protein
MQSPPSLKLKTKDNVSLRNSPKTLAQVIKGLARAKGEKKKKKKKKKKKEVLELHPSLAH